MVSEMLTLETALADQALKLSSSSLLVLSQPPSLQTWPHTAVCNGLHAKSTSLSSSDSMWFECMELCPVNCAISTGIFADLCL